MRTMCSLRRMGMTLCCLELGKRKHPKLHSNVEFSALGSSGKQDFALLMDNRIASLKLLGHGLYDFYVSRGVSPTARVRIGATNCWGRAVIGHFLFRIAFTTARLPRYAWISKTKSYSLKRKHQVYQSSTSVTATDQQRASSLSNVRLTALASVPTTKPLSRS